MENNVCRSAVVTPDGCGFICCRPPNCPISRRAFKDDIRYLDGADRRRLYSELRDIRLARYRYKGEPDSATRRLGFIIDDAPASPAVNADGQTVDLYGYMSMAVAALQEQARKIERLEKEIARLRRSSSP
jgi:hypothetical protein